MTEYLIIMVLSSTLPPVMVIDKFPTEQECQANLKQLGEQVNSELHLESGFPKLKCLQVQFHE